METPGESKREQYFKGEEIKKQILEKAQTIAKQLNPDLVVELSIDPIRNAEGERLEQPGIMLSFRGTQEEFGSMFYIQLSPKYLHNQLKSDMEKHYEELTRGIGSKYN